MKKDSKIQRELQEQLGLDPLGDIFRAIVEFYPSMVDVASLASVGAAIVNVSRTVPLVTVEATKEQFLEIEKIPSVKKIWYNAPVSVTLHNYLPYEALTEPGANDVQITLADTIKWIRADKVHEKGITGKGVKVAVLDTGVNSSHPMLQGKVIAKFQVADGDIEGLPMGHGTWVASCIAGNSIDSPAGPLRSVAPGAVIINGKVLADDGSGFIDGIIQGMEKAVIDYKADILSMSLGRPFDCDSPMWQTLDSLIQQYGVMASVAAGNNGPQNSPSDPGTASRAITVGATSIRVGGGDQVAGFSSRGPSIHKNIYPNVAAPGGAGGGDQLNEYIYGPWGTGYNWVRGTSMATPHVAGLLALLQQKKGSKLSEAEVKKILSSSSVNGHLNETGWGRIDCVNALNFSLPPVQEAFGSGLSGLLTAGLIGGFLLSGGIKNDRR